MTPSQMHISRDDADDSASAIFCFGGPLPWGPLVSNWIGLSLLGVQADNDPFAARFSIPRGQEHPSPLEDVSRVLIGFNVVYQLQLSSI